MRLALLVTCLALNAWPIRPPVAPRPADPRPLDATVTRDGEVVSVTIEAPNRLRLHAQRVQGEVTHDLDLAGLPSESRLVGAQLGAYGDRGLALALALEVAAGTEYRWLFTLGDPLDGQVLEPPQTNANVGWTLSGPLFASSGEPYRLVDIHNPGGDSLELTFRRGALRGVRERAAGFSIDERIVHDVCPLPAQLAMEGSSVEAVVERVVEAP